MGGLSDYSTLLESLNTLHYTILSLRNDQLPINRLPVEILTFICELVLPCGLDSEFAQPNNDRAFCVTKLTHVCKRWRLVLISSPELWTSFRLIRAAPKFVAECIQRSKTLPIHISFIWNSSDPNYPSPSPSADDDGSVEDDGDSNTVDEDDPNQTSSNKSWSSSDGTSSHSTLSVYPDHHDGGYSWVAYIKEAQNFQHLIQQSHRIATLDISSLGPGAEDGEEDNPFACGLFIYPLPALQTLRLSCLGVHSGSIPRVIIDGHITAIKSLLLENIPLTQMVDLSLNITSLTLKSTWSDITIDPGLFLQFLRKNQSLQSLSLHDYKFHPAPDSVTPVVLKNLRRLDFTRGTTPIPRHSVALPQGPRSFFRMETAPQSSCSSAAECPTSPSTLLLGGDPNPSELLSVISGVFGSGWEEATWVVIEIPIGGWEPEFVERLLSSLTRLIDLSVEFRHDRVEPLFDSLRTSKERCPNLRRIRIDIAPEHFPNALRSARKLVEQRAEDGIPLEAVEKTGLSLSAAGIWNHLYDQWRIKDYLKTRGSEAP